ncbi:thioesterase [Pseudoalteromonas citrea]|uniref:Thioesterase n=1 Tax=Pseudoalteromonas citrea TaxID=43655 RepID=A0A5S3XQM8_9GAMM|nr:thioesterase domain-containing protein [Pseudoalteromonas citrea]TMP43891.1 thioesterase [Pseudoalteromonas citrea]TMP58550.1 thioesterase [Pseudoalteromonas citrea]
MSQWYVTPKQRLNADVKLICFPYAGGGVAVYHSWADILPDNIELSIVQLPGRGSHFAATPIDNMEKLITLLYPEIEHMLTMDYVIFGHSLGSRVGFEVARKAVNSGLQAPRHFFASGSGAPDIGCFEKSIHSLPQLEFFAELRQMNGTPAEVLDNVELMKMVEPTLRADFQIAEQYQYKGKDIIPCDVSILYGVEDSIETNSLLNWSYYFESCSLKPFSGDHFFVESERGAVIEHVCDVLDWIGYQGDQEVKRVS